jgi:predicted esterase
MHVVKWLSVVTALLAAFVGPVRAEEKIDTTALRQRLEALSKARPASVPEGALLSIRYVIDVAERIRKSFPKDAPEWQTRARRYLDAAEQGRDPFVEKAELGRIVSRGYSSPISKRVQGYTVYVPPTYTPDKSWPLMIVLHGGSSNGNLFLGVVLGNNMNWKEYDDHLWHRYEPRWSPDWIVVAPDGYGQVLWRYMGEQDVLDVISDVQKHYSVDRNRVALGGLSNGGMGAYSIGSRHAWRFSVVQAMAGAPSWLLYAGEASVAEPEAKIMRSLSAIDLAENWFNTDFRYYHGNVDPGPMRPSFIQRLDKTVQARSIPHRGHWFEAGHDLLYIVHRHGKVYADLKDARQKQKPAEVRVVSGDYRAARQHWLEITRFHQYPDLARLEGRANGSTLEIKTDNVDAFAIEMAEVPVNDTVQLRIDGTQIFDGKKSELGKRAHVVKDGAWKLGAPKAQALEKKPKLSGPISDAYFDRMVHVYGTKNPEHEKDLKKLAEKAARGWPLWLWTVEQEVVADRDLTAEQRQNAHLVLYGTPGDNCVLDEIAGQLPIKVEGEALVAGDKRFQSKGVGTRFIYPNPKNPERYVIVQTAPTVDGVRRGHNLPDFVPDYVIYDAKTTSARARLVPAKAPLARGYFDSGWRL